MLLRTFILLNLVVGSAFPCTCIPPPPEERLRYADAVFRATIVDISKSGKVAMRVTRVWKGDITARVESPALKKTMCMEQGFPPSQLNVGSDLLIYANRSGQTLVPSGCVGSIAAKDAMEDLAALGPGRAPR